ncbi:MAG: NAD(P)H-hydrate dehydratase [Candidatus Roizmanbacteria bacterium]|nr:NAD(P)H-hydrate dehydratase [Candidatus Roizmanbacteria bacterium]
MKHIHITTQEIRTIHPYLKKLYISSKSSHKGQNGKVLVIGGSSLFHSSPIWAAEIASHFADMVHFSSTEENNEIILSLKKSFRDGMIIHQKDIPDYVIEDDAILVGPGMVRKELSGSAPQQTSDFKTVLAILDEGEYVRSLMYYLLHQHSQKRYVIDAGALQMIDREWLHDLSEPAIITPHKYEFERLFGISVEEMSTEEKEECVRKIAKENNCVILLKSIDDFVSDGTTSVTIVGGTQGLTKGGTGDVLSGLVVSLYAKNDPITSAVVASFLEKRAAEVLREKKGHWFNTTELLEIIPEVLTDLVYN